MAKKNAFWKNLTRPYTILAPMDDVTDYVFREIVSDIAKPDILFTEFTSTDGLFSKGHDKVANRLFYSERQRPIVAQIWGAEPELFYKTALYLADLGFDGIDINMGCPDETVMKRGCGAGMINNKDLTLKLVEALNKGAPELQISIKTRLDTTPELTKEWFEFLLSLDIDALTIHARTAEAKSKGDANWNEIGMAVELKNKINPHIALVGNGDIKTYTDVVEKYNTYKVDGVMIGRGIFNNPWVFEKSLEQTDHSVAEHLALLVKHTNMFDEKWGSTKNFDIMKKFFKIYVKGFRGADDLRTQLMLCKTTLEVNTAIRSFTEENL